ncbi:MAG: Zn-dependent hydrolase [Chromatiales bacterium]|jgi:beta-ureidopropionase / N-carbamoyl-L-amino-acid hydrolase|nr:Zn-dependent hydrolase [Chromatiales bacterium]
MDGDNQLRVDGERLWDTLMRSGEIGPGRAGGLCRLPLTEADREMRDLFVQWCRDARCTITIDKLGNIFARRAGEDDSLAPVLVGSHLDTQVAGGKYDGILGVLSGLEILRTLNDAALPTRRAIEVVCWTNEEGARFQPPMQCSGAFAGVHTVEWVLDSRDDDGAVFGEELAKIGYDGDAPVGGRDLDSYFELHIEQGPELEASGVPLGVVVGGYFSRGMVMEVHGENAHAGPTPMDKRRNSLVGASMLVVAANEIGWEYHPEEGKSTATRMLVWPNKPGILPDWAEVTVDFRHPDKAKTLEMEAKMLAAIPGAAKRANVDIEVTKNWEFGNEVFDAECLDLLRRTARELDIPYTDMLSQAGHDAYHMTRVTPTAMLFSPCKDGISHNENEHIELDYTLPSVNVLLHAVIARANR